MENHVILCGYGRVGQEISNQIKTQNIPIIVVESDEDRKKDCRRKWFRSTLC